MTESKIQSEPCVENKYIIIVTFIKLYLPHYELTLGESTFYVFLEVNSPKNDIEKEFFEISIATSRYELLRKWERW